MTRGWQLSRLSYGIDRAFQIEAQKSTIVKGAVKGPHQFGGKPGVANISRWRSRWSSRTTGILPMAARINRRGPAGGMGARDLACAAVNASFPRSLYVETFAADRCSSTSRRLQSIWHDARSQGDYFPLSLQGQGLCYGEVLFTLLQQSASVSRATTNGSAVLLCGSRRSTATRPSKRVQGSAVSQRSRLFPDEQQIPAGRALDWP